MSGFFNSADFVLTWRTILVGMVCNVACAILGCYLVLRRMSLLGDAISHAVLPGIAVAFILTGHINGWVIVAGAMAVGMLTTFLTQSFHQLGRVPEDASMGVVFTSLFALGVILINNFASHVDIDPGCVLYGLIEFVPLDTITLGGVTVPRAMLTMAPMLLLTVGFVLLLWKELKIASFDPALATAIGINATLIHYLLMAMVAAVTVTSFEAVGAVLVVAMLIVPAASAHLLTDRLGWMMVWSVVIAIFAAVFGSVLGRVWNTSVAGMMAVGTGVAFLLAVLLAPRHGLISKVIRNARLALRITCEDILAMDYRLEEAIAHRAGPEEIDRIRRAYCRTSGPWLLWTAHRLLQWRGFLQVEVSGPMLTEEGRRRARIVIRAHRLWEAYLEKDFELPPDHVHDVAERMEHYIGPDLQSELATQLGEPATDPHGQNIPPASPHPQ